MERLSSCYFCGDAVDAAIEEYPLVVSQTYSDLETGERIVLCPSCRRKLTTVIEHVLEAALNGDGEVDPADIPAVTDEDVLIDVDGPSNGNGDPVTATDVEPLDSDPDADPGDDSAEIEQTPPDQSPPDNTGSESRSDSAANPVGESGGGMGSDEDSTWVQAGETAEDETRETASADDRTSETASADDEGESAPSHSFERAEYNKIVKLLQNREFPVDIEEFTVVAQGAYGIDRTTTHEILDALIERGVIEDKGDHLVRT